MKFIKENWANVLRKAMGNLSQTKFSEYAGISRVSLNYYLNLKSSSQPSYDYAIKIAKASELVKLNEVLIAAGYDPIKNESEESADSSEEEKLVKDIMHLLLSEGEISYGENLDSKKRNEIINLLKKSIEIKKM